MKTYKMFNETTHNKVGKDNNHRNMVYYKNNIQEGKKMRKKSKKQQVILTLIMAIALTALPQQAIAVTASPQTYKKVSPTQTPKNGPDLVAKYCDTGFKKLKDRSYLIPKNGKMSFAANDLTEDKHYGSLLDDAIYITIKKIGGCSVKVSFSDPSVASCKVEIDRDRKSRKTSFTIEEIKSKKAGTTTMTITIRVGKSVREYSCKLTFKKYQKNPVKSFKLGKKNFAFAFSPKKAKVRANEVTNPARAKLQTLKVKKKQKKLKLSVKLKKGYRIKNIWRVGKYGSYNKVKNGTKLKLSKHKLNKESLYVEYIDKDNSVYSLGMYVKIKRK